MAEFLVQKEPDDLLKAFMCDDNPLDNFLGLVDLRNHQKEDNLRSAKYTERVETVKKLLELLGYESCVVKAKLDEDTLEENWG